jgi:hypothetical protein
MMIPGPQRLDESGLERILSTAARQTGASPEGLDLSAVVFADPYGLLGLLSLGLSAAYRKGQAWGLILPRDGKVRSYLDRTGSTRHLEQLFVLDGSPRTTIRTPKKAEAVLLEATPIRAIGDIHRVVARVKARTDRLLVSRLGYNVLAADRFTVALAEICQNIVDHSGSEGFVAAQSYASARPGDRPMIRLAVADVGMGVRRSLAARYASRHPGTWDDRTAVRLAFRRWVSRFDEPGRGLGLKLVAEMVRGWGGRLLLRSGTAAYAICPPWGPRPRRTGLPFFPGAQINIFLPHFHR